MSEENSFHPTDHLIQLKSQNGPQPYLPVQWRLVWFREVCPEGTIYTEEVCVDLDREVEEEVKRWNSQTRSTEVILKKARGYARFRAVVTDGRGGSASATKCENAASFPDFVEKAETGAIGRALAGLGFGTQFTADELDEGPRIVDAPLPAKKNEPAPPLTELVEVEKPKSIDLTLLRKRFAAAWNKDPGNMEHSWTECKTKVLGRTEVEDEKLTEVDKSRLQLVIVKKVKQNEAEAKAKAQEPART